MPIPWSQTLYSMPATAAAVTAASDTELVPNAVVTFQPNFFHIGTKLRIHASGVISTTSGSNTMTFTPKLGTAVICASFGAITMIASQTTQKWWLDLDIECRAEGAGESPAAGSERGGHRRP